MPDLEFPKVKAETAAEVCRGRSLSAPAQALLNDELSPRAFLDRLTAASHFDDAAVVLAHSLPKREAVWWAVRCVRRALGAEPKPEFEEAMKAAETWAAAPGDVNRRRAYPAAETAGFGHPAGGSALAAFFSGGSLVPPNLPEVPPAEHLTADCVASAVQISAVLNDPARAEENQRANLEIGLDVARGKDRWKDNL